jgi:glutathione synthase
MKIGFVVNDVDTEVPTAATTLMAWSAAGRGHDVWMLGVGELTYEVDGRIVGQGRPAAAARDQAAFLAAVQGREAPRERIDCTDLDVLYLRYNPVEGIGESMWEQDAGMAFGQLAVHQGVIVLSHPYTLSYAVSKMYFQHLPESVRPRTVITRSIDEILAFYKREKKRIVLKPMHGYGGKDVYLLGEDITNLKQIVETISRTSYVVAQEFIPAATRGDVRLFLLNGRPLMAGDSYAAVRRVNSSDDFRSNMSAGGKPKKARVTARMLEIAEIVRPRIVADGLFFVGLDIVGDRLVEINTISAGGLNAASKLEGVNFGDEVIRAIERKVAYRQAYGARLTNLELATMD